MGSAFVFVLFLKNNRKEEQSMKKILTSLLLLLLAAVLACGLISCADIDKTGDWETATYDRDTKLGKGDKTITVQVIADGQTLTFTVKTDKENLEDALVEVDLIDGDESAFGLYIKKVNGIVADYDTDKTYWAITKSGEETLGAKSTLIADGDCYEFTKTVSEW